jgi:IS1 family transposase
MNKLSTKARAQILEMMVEGVSIRAISRLTGASKNTVVKLLEDAGAVCANYHYNTVQNVPCKRIQCDEIWAFVYAKAKNAPRSMRVHGQAGDVWTWTAIDADTKLIVSWLVGNRDTSAATQFMMDVSRRVANRVQLTTDGHKAYLNAAESAFHENVDYAMLQKLYGNAGGKGPERRYSSGECCGTIKGTVCGEPDAKHISTSYVERQNLTMRMSMRRFTRLTNGFSKKVDNHVHALAIYFMHYNFIRVHSSIRVTPAMEAGIAKSPMSFEDVIAMVDAANPLPAKRGPYTKKSSAS